MVLWISDIILYYIILYYIILYYIILYGLGFNNHDMVLWISDNILSEIHYILGFI